MGTEKTDNSRPDPTIHTVHMRDLVKERKSLLKQEIKRMVAILKREYQPQQIILFGSVAKGKIHAWSDIDLLIVKDTSKRPVERCIEVCKIVKPTVGVDVFVYTPSEYQALLKENVVFIKNVLKNGTVVYAQRD